jgi:hypothetical protein
MHGEERDRPVADFERATEERFLLAWRRHVDRRAAVDGEAAGDEVLAFAMDLPPCERHQERCRAGGGKRLRVLHHEDVGIVACDLPRETREAVGPAHGEVRLDVVRHDRESPSAGLRATGREAHRLRGDQGKGRER